MSGLLLVKNRRATFEYELIKKYEAGIVLSGAEVKSVRLKHANLTGSFIRITDGQAFLVNAQISPYVFAPNDAYDPKQTRRLLLRKSELYALAEATSQKGITLVPLAIILQGRHIKIEFATARGKKQHDKRETIKRRTQAREMARGEW